jgi:LytS/YehU family sensor histidine kinase
VPFIFTILTIGFALHYLGTQEQLAIEAASRSEAELRMLRAQLEPHMLFNTLANLRSLVKEDVQLAELMIDQLIIYLRSALLASRKGSTTLSDEFDQLRAFLGIMAIRMGSRLSFVLTLPAEMEKFAVPPMLLQPLVENAIKHGLEPKIGAGKIEVVAHAHESTIEISVIDTGLGLLPRGLSAERSDVASGGFGLQHVRQSLQSTFGAGASLVLKSAQPSGVCAVITIPR